MVLWIVPFSIASGSYHQQLAYVYSPPRPKDWMNITVHSYPLLDTSSTYRRTTGHSLRRGFIPLKNQVHNGIPTEQNRVVTLVVKGRASSKGHARLVGIQSSQFSTVPVETKWSAVWKGCWCAARMDNVYPHSFAFPPTPMPLCH